MKSWLCLLSLVALWPYLARAGFELQWQTPSSCTSHPDTAALVGEASGKAEVELRERGGGWLVTVLFFEPAVGVRRVSAASCEEAVRAAGLLVRMGSRGAFETPPAPAPPTPSPAPAPERPREWSLTLSGGAAVDVGTGTRVEPRIALGFTASRGALLIGADVRIGVGATSIEGLRVTRAVELQPMVGLMGEWGRLSGGAGLAVSLGSWSVVSPAGPTALAALVSAGPQARGAVALISGLTLGAIAGLRFNLTRPAPFTDAGVLFTTPELSGDLQLTLGWRW